MGIARIKTIPTIVSKKDAYLSHDLNNKYKQISKQLKKYKIAISMSIFLNLLLLIKLIH